jgi:hypothetical protein
VRGHRQDQIRDFKQALVSLKARAKSLQESGLGNTLPNESAIRGNKMVCTNKSHALVGVQRLKTQAIPVPQFRSRTSMRSCGLIPTRSDSHKLRRGSTLQAMSGVSGLSPPRLKSLIDSR